MKFSRDFWMHILIGGGTAAGLALVQFIGHQDFGSYNLYVMLGSQAVTELLNQIRAKDAAAIAPPSQGVGGRDPNIMRGFALAAGITLAMSPGYCRYAKADPLHVARNQTPIEFATGTTAATGSTTPSAAGPFSGVIADAINFFATDFDEAAKLATEIPALQDNNGKACWTRASSIGVLLKAHPLPLTLKAATDLEALRLFSMAINQMCADPACTQVFTDLANGIQQVGVGIPVPSLTAICAKIPTITPGPALTVLPAPTIIIGPAGSNTVLTPAAN